MEERVGRLIYNSQKRKSDKFLVTQLWGKYIFILFSKMKSSKTKQQGKP